MKHALRLSVVMAVALATSVPTAIAQLTIPNANGSDGVLIVSGNTTISLANAGTGSWTNTSASPGNGTYDPEQWAVVFKYSSVVISNGATLSFSNHPTHAPVVWLVSNNVVINGNLNLDGKDGDTNPNNLAEPGPGGFRGGGGPIYGAGYGFGPGGGFGCNVGNGRYATTYGNPQIIPLIGGSGSGGGGCFTSVANGGSGGGAILIAASGTITVNGSCHADGGGNANLNVSASGGAIRLVANQILGSGRVEAISAAGPAANGRIRLEANSVANGITNNPPTTGVTPDNPPTIFPPAAATVRIYSINAITNGLTDPKAVMANDTSADDMTLVTTNAVIIRLQTQNFPTNGTVTVYVKPRNSVATNLLSAAFVSGNTNSAFWQTSTTLLYPSHTIIQARATY